MRRIPAITPEIGKAFNSEEIKAIVVTAEGARDREHARLIAAKKVNEPKI
jgi:hypothetical protein